MEVPELPKNIYLERVRETIIDPNNNVDELEDWIDFSQYLLEMNAKHDLSEAEWNQFDGWDIWIEDAESIANKCKQWVEEDIGESVLDSIFSYEWFDVVGAIRESDPKLQEVPLQDLADYWRPDYKLVANGFYGFKRKSSD
mgnify:CR=1 FL=1